MSERLIRLLRTRVAPPAGVTDAALLARWADRRDEAAFELLLRRHAAPVWRTCRAVAGEGAEDAFQATFLALARRAGAVRENLPGWLWRVARHASLRARRAAGVSRPTQPLAATSRLPLAGSAGLHRPLASEDVTALHDELARLPESYRVPVLLCHLHGLTQAETAAQLGLPLGTVATRVRRGCDRLRVALTRRGLAPAVGFGPPLILPAGLIPATLGVGLGATAAPPAVHLLAKGAVSAMSRTKLKLLAVVAAAGGAIGSGALVARNPAADPPPKPAPQPAAKWEPKPADYFDRKASMNRLKQVMLSLHNFHDANGDKLPRDIAGPDGKPLLSWRVAVLPYIGEGFLHTQLKLDEPWDSPTNRRLAGYVPEEFRSTGAGAGRTRVKMFRGPNAALDPTKPISLPGVTDGTSNTLGVAEAGPAVEWTRPADLDVAADKPLPDLAGPFTDGFPAGMLDGSVRWLRRSVPEKTLRELVSRDGGEVTNWDEAMPASPKRPPTDREKKQAAVWRAQLERGRAYDQLMADQRLAATLAAVKLGPIPLPEVPAADDLFALEQAVNNGWQWSGANAHEFDRLVALVKGKDPATAAKLQKDFDEKLMKLRTRNAPK